MMKKKPNWNDLKWHEKHILLPSLIFVDIIKLIFYRAIIRPSQTLWFWILRFYMRNIYGTWEYNKENWYMKVLTYIFFMSLFFILLKQAEYMFYEPKAWEEPPIWPRKIKLYRRRILAHWISFMWIYTLVHLATWTSLKLSAHFQYHAWVRYFDIWFWYNAYFHGIYYDTAESYMNLGTGIPAVVYFIIVNGAQIGFCWAGEWMEEMEYDWDDFDNEYEGAYYRDEYGSKVAAYSEENQAEFVKEEQMLINELAWDIFGAEQAEPSEEPHKLTYRWALWFTIVYPPKTSTDDDLLYHEAELEIIDIPRKAIHALVLEFDDVDDINRYGPEVREWWWPYQLEQREIYFVPLVFPWLIPLKWFFVGTLIPFHTLVWKRIRAVGEYSRYNWRFKNYMKKWIEVPPYEGVGEYNEYEAMAILKYFGYMLVYLHNFWWRSAKMVWKRWGNVWGPFMGFFEWAKNDELKKLKKWGSKNYTFFGKKNYKPKWRLKWLIFGKDNYVPKK